MTTKTVKVEITGDPSSFERSMTVVSESASKATSNVEAKASRVGGAFRGLDNQLGAFGIPFTGALSEIGNKFDEMETHGASAFKKLAEAGKAVTIGVAAAAAGIAVESIHLADQFEKAHASLETAVKNTGGSMEKLNPIIDDQESKFAKLGYTQTQYQAALARGVIGTGNAQKAIILMGQAADLAAFSHTDLEKAMTAVVKASEGQLRPLKQLGIDLPIVAANAVAVAKAQDKVAAADEAGRLVQEKVNDGRLKGVAATDALRAAYKKISDAMQELNDKTNSGSEILKALHEKTMGAAEKQSETFQGKIKALEAQLTNMGIKIGLFLIPIVEDLTTAIMDTIDWFEKHKAAAIAVAAVITTVLGAAITAFVVNKVASFVTGIQTMLTNLGLLQAKAVETAAAVEGAGAESAAGGAAAGGEAAGGGILATLGPLLLIVGAAAAVAYGLAKVFGESENVRISFRGLASGDVPQLTKSLEENRGKLDQLNGALDGYGIHVTNAAVNHREFNKILNESPQYADAFIQAISAAGGSTDWFSQKLLEHEAAAERAKVAQERFALQMEIVDAKARGDAASVYGLTLQLNALPTDHQIDIAVHSDQAVANAQAVLDALNALPREVQIGIEVGALNAANTLGNTPVATSDRNVKRNIVPVSWN